jgi:DNA polymerase-3 subunit epsilon
VTFNSSQKLLKGSFVRLQCPNLRPMRFAVTDIETTGSHAAGNSIIEIGVVILDGDRVVEEFTSLIDPGVQIPSYISGLTGITGDMIQGAPTFHQVADKLEELFEGAVFVAHNVSFDYSFIKAEFAAIGRNWNPPRLCTVRLARKAFPGQVSYGLNAICNWMGLTNEQAHRALSDARVACRILMESLPLIEPNEMLKLLAKQNGVVFLPPNLPEEVFKRLPEAPGVYYMYNEKGKPIYIGKAKNIKKRVRQHFTANTDAARSQSFMREVRDIGFELTGNELLALLMEDAEIRKHWPPHNSAQKRKTRRVHVIRYVDQVGYSRLAAAAAVNAASSIRSFPSMAEANRWLYGLASEFSIDPRLLGLAMFDSSSELPNSERHNEVLDDAIRLTLSRDPSYIIESAGRSARERAYIWVERGILKGYAFMDEGNSDLNALEFHLKPLPHSENSGAILDSFAGASWGYRRIEIKEGSLP